VPGSLPLARLAVHVVSTLGVSKVVNDIIRNNTVVTNTIDAVKVSVGSLVVGSMIAQQATKHVNERMDAAVGWYKNRNTDETDLKIVE
jgi:hypothetical protein